MGVLPFQNIPLPISSTHLPGWFVCLTLRTFGWFFFPQWLEWKSWILVSRWLVVIVSHSIGLAWAMDQELNFQLFPDLNWLLWSILPLGQKESLAHIFFMETLPLFSVTVPSRCCKFCQTQRKRSPVNSLSCWDCTVKTYAEKRKGSLPCYFQQEKRVDVSQHQDIQSTLKST